MNGISESECLSSTSETGEPKPKGDPAEGRKAPGKRNCWREKMKGTPRPENVSTKIQRVAELAKEAPRMAFTNLAHHVDQEFLREAYRRTRKNGAVGVDGQTAEEYAANLDVNLERLLNRFKSGTYKAPPVRRVHIPKGDGKKTRPIGIPSFEDKVLQRAVVMVLEAIYEQDFLNCSYGFRPGRSALQAVEALQNKLMDLRGGWVLEVDIQDFFGSLDFRHLRSFLEQRVRDGVIRRIIDKWLKAGVMEDGRITRPEIGSPQGGVVSPILANVYLHEVMDKWFVGTVVPKLRGQAHLVRYCDDMVMIFANEDDARRVMEVLPKRFGKYGLTLHPEKTRLVPFNKPRANYPGKGDGTGVFDFLGFCHYWGKSRKGYWVVKRKTSRDRFRRAVRSVTEWCRTNRHDPVREQCQTLCLKLRGHYGYYGITGNYDALSRFYLCVKNVWFKWLNRRDQRRHITWQKFADVLIPSLPKPRVTQSIYTARP